MSDFIRQLNDLFKNITGDNQPTPNTCTICGVVIDDTLEMCADCWQQAGMVSVVALTDPDLWEFMTGEEADFD